MTRFQKNLLLGLFVMAVLSPIGIVLPDKFGAGDAWGEWGPETIKRLLGYVPQGMARFSELWGAPVADYSIKGLGESLAARSGSYIISAVLGIILAGGLIYLISKLIIRHND